MRAGKAPRPERNREARALGPWVHNLHLPDGTCTEPGHPLGDFPAFKWKAIAPHLPADLSGWMALDIGCNAGFYSFELARRGARVLGIDLDPRYLAQAGWAAGKMGLKGRVRFRQMQVYDLARLRETFDLVLFLGVLYHLRYPMLGLDIVSRKVGRLMVFQTLTLPGRAAAEAPGSPGAGGRLGLNDRSALRASTWPKMAFLERGFAGDPTNWWCANRACVEAMLRSCGLEVAARPGDEIWICGPDPEHPGPMSTWNESEYLAAAGLPWRRKLEARIGGRSR
jgi:tRNA (mo5U34)-methyltransferase